MFFNLVICSQICSNENATLLATNEYSSKSSNAVLAKTLAKYGKRLTDKDYASLLSCKSVSEVVTYLKNNTSYKEILKKVNEREVHRGRLELILRQKLAEDFSFCQRRRSISDAGAHR